FANMESCTYCNPTSIPPLTTKAYIGKTQSNSALPPLATKALRAILDASAAASFLLCQLLSTTATKASNNPKIFSTVTGSENIKKAKGTEINKDIFCNTEAIVNPKRVTVMPTA